MKNYKLLLLMIALGMVSCKKNSNAELPSLDQYLQFTIDGQSYSFHESDTTEFILIPAFEQNFLMFDTARYEQIARIQTIHTHSDGSKSGESAIMKFAGHFIENQTVREDQFCMRLKEEDFLGFFQNPTWNIPGKFNEIQQERDRSFYFDLFFNNENNNSYWSSTVLSNSPMEDSLVQHNSFMTIDSLKECVHPQHGEGLLLFGHFELNIISPQGVNTRLENGAFKICAIKCR